MATMLRQIESLRAEGLAKVFLTRTGELDVIPVDSDAEGRGYDLLVRSAKDGPSGAPLFAVVVRTSKQDRGSVKAVSTFDMDTAELERFDLPLLLLHVDTVREEGYFGWLVEPVIDPSGIATVRARRRRDSTDRETSPAKHDHIHKLDNEAVRRLTHQVLAWRDARHHAASLVFPNRV